MPSSHIVIAGHAPINLVLYPPKVESHLDASLQKSRMYWSRGGASLIAGLLKGVEELMRQVHIHEPPPINSVHNHISSIIELDIHSINNDSNESSAFKLKCSQELNAQPRWHSPVNLPLDDDNTDVSILILQDTEGTFNNSDSEAAIQLVGAFRSRFLLYHMARPLCAGKIWEDVRHGPYKEMSERDPERVIGIYLIGLGE